MDSITLIKSPSRTYPVKVLPVKLLARFVDIKELDLDAKLLKVFCSYFGSTPQADVAGMGIVLIGKQKEALRSDSLCAENGRCD